MFNANVTVKIVMRIPNAMQVGVLGFFLAEIIVRYFEEKKCS